MKNVFAKLGSKKNSAEKEAPVLIKNNLQQDIHIEEMTFPSIEADSSYPAPNFKSFSHVKTATGNTQIKRPKAGMVANGTTKVRPK